MTHTTAHPARGLGELAFSLFGGNRAAENRAQTEESDVLSQIALRTAQQRKALAEARLGEDRLSNLPGLAESVSTLFGGTGAPETMGPAAATSFRAAGGDTSDLAGLVRTLVELERGNRAITLAEGGNQGISDVALAAAGRTPVKPFSQTAAGSVLNESTGAVNQANPIALGTIADLAAKALAGEALADQRGAAADLSRATVPLRGAEVLAAEALAGQRGAAADLSRATIPVREAQAGKEAALADKARAEVKAKEAGTRTFNATELNAVRRMVKDFFGDKIRFNLSGEFAFADQKTALDAAAMIERAELNFRSGMDLAAAVNAAARDLGLNVPTTSQPALTGRQGGAAPGGDPLDPKNIRRFLFGTE